MSEYRVDELASTAGISVDTLRFYQHRGLLAPPERRGRVGYYGDAHLERLRRIKDLQQQGLSLTTIARVLDGLHPADAALVAAITATEGERRLSLAELATETGVPEELLQSLISEGLLSPGDPDAEDRPYDDADVRAVRAGLTLLESGIPLGALLDLAREYTAAVDAVAERAVALFDEHIRRPTKEEQAAVGPDAQVLAAFEELLPAAGTLIRHQFERAVLRAARARIDIADRDPG